MTRAGFKPATFRTGIWRSIQLSYQAFLQNKSTKFFLFEIAFSQNSLALAAEKEAQMLHNRLPAPVVMLHDQKSLFERSLMIFVSYPPPIIQRVHQNHFCIDDIASSLKNTNTPIEISWKSVFHVVRRCYQSLCNKSLMAYQHTIRKTSPLEFERRTKPS